MIKKIKFILLIIFLFNGTSFVSVAQTLDQSYLDTLKYETLLTLFEKFRGDSSLQEKIARTYLDRARSQKDTIKMARGYDRLARIFHPEKNIMFADSLIFLTRGTGNITYPALGYLIKSGNTKNEVDRINNILEAYKISKINNNVNQQLHALSLFFTLKNNWGNTQEAYQLLKENEKLLKQKDILSKLQTSFRKGRKNSFVSQEELSTLKVYNDLDHIDSFLSFKMFDSITYRGINIKNYLESCKYCNKELIKRYYDFQILEMNYLQKKYDSVLYTTTALYDKKEDFVQRDLLQYHFYRGSAFLKLGKVEEGLKHFDEIDRNISFEYFYPKHRNIYDTLIKYSHIKSLPKSKNWYLKRLVELSTLLLETTKAVEPSIIKYVETPQLIAEKDALITQLEKEKRAPDPKLYIALSALTLSLSFLFFYVRKRLVYKKRFEKLLAQQNMRGDPEFQAQIAHNTLSNDVVEDILKKLEAFEQQHAYLNASITLQTLAKKFRTNSNYLSRVINLKREKNFSQYLHELRIGYAVEELLPNASYRKYTIKAIAEECGYNNAESFSRAFYKSHGIYPSYYIKKLEENA